LLSPARLSGERAKLLFRPQASFPLAEQLRSSGAPLGEVFAFLSGLYFRGKKAYAETFGKAPPGMGAGLVISAGEGLRFLHEPVTLERLRGWADVDISDKNRRFLEPLVQHAEALNGALGESARFVLLGSVASDKYVQPLTRVFGERLLFPPDFVGRGDMSRGGLLLRAARAGEELSYAPVAGAMRHGPRPPRLTPLRRSKPPTLEVVVLMGLPGAGKTTFFEQRFSDTHRPISKDASPNQRRPAKRQAELIAQALDSGSSVIVDNTNASRAERAAIIELARAHEATVSGFFFECTTRECVARNAGREGRARVPNVAIFATAKRLDVPRFEEGFDALYRVKPLPEKRFEVVPYDEPPVAEEPAPDVTNRT
jgi:predicted kinase